MERRWRLAALVLVCACGGGSSPILGPLELSSQEVPTPDGEGDESLGDPAPDGSLSDPGTLDLAGGEAGSGDLPGEDGSGPLDAGGDEGPDGRDLPIPCPWDCDDGNACTRDWCDEAVGLCRSEEIPGCKPCRDGGDCSDRDGCTRDLCQDGRCVWEAIPIPGCISCVQTGMCDDGNPCTIDRCVGEGYCVFECNCRSLCLSDQDCWTGDLCAPGRCLVIRGQEGACSETVCVAAPVPPCEDGDACTVDRCDPRTGRCEHTPLEGCVSCGSGDSCDDLDPCTIDQCDPERGVCVHLPERCDDGKACTRDWCEEGWGCRHSPLSGFCERDEDCQDADPCTWDSCDQEQGCCRLDLIPGCRVCRQNQDCEDHDPCTEDFCDPNRGTCWFVWTTSPCEDGEVCTEGDQCWLGICRPGEWKHCNDNNPCTDDHCEPGLGCRFVENTLPCDDQDACTEGDQCSRGACLAKTLVTCDDGVLCTQDGCNPETGCWHRLDLQECDCRGRDENCLMPGQRTCCRPVRPGGIGEVWRCRIGDACL